MKVHNEAFKEFIKPTPEWMTSGGQQAEIESTRKFIASHGDLINEYLTFITWIVVEMERKKNSQSQGEDENKNKL